MNRILILLLTLLLICSSVTADEKLCPADRAVKLGYTPFGAFHEIMAPAWHVSWPDSNFEALFEAGPEFKEKFVDIAKLEPAFKSEKRNADFIELRKNFATLVDEYATAAKEKNKNKVYELMPKLHDAFVFTATSLLPIHYPQIEEVIITVNLILENHIPKNNMIGITESTATLITKLKGYTPKTLPDELQEHEKEIEQAFKNMLMLAILMEKYCNENDMENYNRHIKNLDKSLKQFVEKYI